VDDLWTELLIGPTTAHQQHQQPTTNGHPATGPHGYCRRTPPLSGGGPNNSGRPGSTDNNQNNNNKTNNPVYTYFAAAE